MNVVLAELQRQAEAERRSMQRQLEHLERRQEQMGGSGGSGGRERWAEIQGSVSGLLEEMSSLSRRVEGLDEKLRTRVSGCEELVRQRTREVEQQIHAQQQKAALAMSTSEEMSKRHAARLRKIGQSVEEHARHLTALDESSAQRRPGAYPNDVLQLEARLCELEGQQASLEEEFRNLASVQDGAAAAALFNGHGTIGSVDSRGAPLGASLRGSALDGDADAILRALERDMARLTQGIDEHAASLANLRVRSDGQEQRLAATYERLETVVATPLEAFRSEVLQLRDHDRQETEGQLSHLARRLQALAEATDDTSTELREGLLKLTGGLQAIEPREESTAMRKLMDTTVAQEQSIRRLEASLRDSQKGGVLSEDLCDVLVRVETLEHRSALLEQAGLNADEINDKADRNEVVRLQAALQELSEPLRRLSQRTASGEAKITALERQVERLRQEGGEEGGKKSSGLLSAHGPSEDLSVLVSAANAKADAVSKELGVIRARLMEVESHVEDGGLLEGSADSSQLSVHDRPGRRPPAGGGVDKREVQDIAERLDRLAAQVGEHETMREELARTPALEQRFVKATREVQSGLEQLRAQHEELSQRVATTASTATSGGIGASEEALRELQEDLEELREQLPEVAKAAASGGEAKSEIAELARRVENDRQVAGEVQGRLEAKLEAVERRQQELAEVLPAGDGGDIAQVREDLEELRRHQEEIHQELRKASEDVRSSCDAGVGQLKGQQEEMAAAAKSHEARVQEEFRGVVERYDADKELLQEMRSQMQEVEQKMATAGGGGGGGAAEERLAEVASRLDGFEDKAKQLQASHEDLSERLTSGLEAQAKAQTEVQQQLQESPPQLQEALTCARGAEEKSKELQSKVDDVKELLSKQVTELRQELDKSLDESRADAAGREKKVTEILSSVESGEGATQRLHDEVRAQLQKLAGVAAAGPPVAAAAVPALPAAPAAEVQELRQALEALRGQVAASASPTDAGVHAQEVQERFQASAERIAKAEKAVVDLQHDALETFVRLDKLRDEHERLKSSSPPSEVVSPTAGKAGDGEAIAALKAELKELAAQVREAVERVEASEAATSAVREELMTGGGSGGGALATTGGVAVWDEGLEERVRELQEQVASELDAIKGHQLELAKVCEAKGGAGPGEKVEKAVEDLARQVEVELSDLRKHQALLEDVRSKVQGGGQSRGLASNAPTSRAGGGGEIQVPQQLEAQISDLFQQVSDELVALTAQQKDLGAAKSTLADIAGQMKDVRGIVAQCQSATGSLRQLVAPEGANGAAAPGAISATMVASATGRGAKATGSATTAGRSAAQPSSGRSPGRRASPSPGSDESDGYDEDDFDNSVTLDEIA